MATESDTSRPLSHPLAPDEAAPPGDALNGGLIVSGRRAHRQRQLEQPQALRVQRLDPVRRHPRGIQVQDDALRPEQAGKRSP